jgi:hypothetical protein
MTLHEDLLIGAGRLAEWFYGSDTPGNRRKIYYLNSEIRGERRPPFFVLGNSQLCGRPSKLLAWIAAAEEEAAR